MKLDLRRNNLSRVRRQKLLGAKDPARKGKGHVWVHEAKHGSSKDDCMLKLSKHHAQLLNRRWLPQITMSFRKALFGLC